jgi:tetratricopeptide (TPR) repeat protein
LGVAIVLFVANDPTAAQRSGLTGGPQLARAYDAVFDARFEEVPALLKETCPPARAEACQLMEVVSLWWQIQMDSHDTDHDVRFGAMAGMAIEAADAWTGREPMRAEAWFYLGGAYGARAQWRALRGETLAAARDGKRIKQALEQALTLDPSMHDAHFGIGLYRYYADVVPAVARVLRWLLLLPGGDREDGLARMLKARSAGQLLASEADYQLALIYLWYEQQPQRSVDLLTALRARFPHNPHFLQLTAEIEENNLGNPTASLKSWQALLDAARADDVAEPEVSEVRARLGIARQLERLGEADAALSHLRAVIAAKPAAPYGALAQAHLQLGQTMQRLEMRAEAMAAYRASLALVPEDDRTRIAPRAREGLRATRR